MTGSDVIAMCALAFTIGSFWWLNARAGTLEVAGEPPTYAFAAADKLILNLPLVFTNPRPTAVVALNLRLGINAEGFPPTASFQATRENVKPEEGGRAMSSSIVVQGRETRLINCEFMSAPFDFSETQPANARITLEALMPGRRGPSWKPLSTFELRVSEQTLRQRAQYLTYENGPLLT